jgi:hypothetical protein
MTFCTQTNLATVTDSGTLVHLSCHVGCQLSLAGQRAAGEPWRRRTANGDARLVPEDAADDVEHNGTGAATLGSPEIRRRRGSAAVHGELLEHGAIGEEEEGGEVHDVLWLTLDSLELTAGHGEVLNGGNGAAEVDGAGGDFFDSLT